MTPLKAFIEKHPVLTYYALVFAIIALFVGTFVIYNSFSIIVAQRTREMALLRAIGARRRQVRRAVVVEAIVIGLAGSVLGFLAGLGVAYVISGDFAGWNFGLDEGGWGGLLIATILMATMYTCMVFGLAELSSTISPAVPDGSAVDAARRAAVSCSPSPGLVWSSWTSASRGS